MSSKDKSNWKLLGYNSKGNKILYKNLYYIHSKKDNHVVTIQNSLDYFNALDEYLGINTNTDWGEDADLYGCFRQLMTYKVKKITKTVK